MSSDTNKTIAELAESYSRTANIWALGKCTFLIIAAIGLVLDWSSWEAIMLFMAFHFMERIDRIIAVLILGFRER